jgi:hypothetical protein
MQTYRPPPNGKAQGRDLSLSLAARREALPKSRLARQKYPFGLRGSKDHPFCCYCRQLITPAHDAQRIDRRTFAHSTCAWYVNDNFFAGLDAMEAENLTAPQFVAAEQFYADGQSAEGRYI